MRIRIPYSHWGFAPTTFEHDLDRHSAPARRRRRNRGHARGHRHAGFVPARVHLFDLARRCRLHRPPLPKRRSGHRRRKGPLPAPGSSSRSHALPTRTADPRGAGQVSVIRRRTTSSTTQARLMHRRCAGRLTRLPFQPDQKGHEVQVAQPGRDTFLQQVANHAGHR